MSIVLGVAHFSAACTWYAQVNRETFSDLMATRNRLPTIEVLHAEQVDAEFARVARLRAIDQELEAIRLRSHQSEAAQVAVLIAERKELT